MSQLKMRLPILKQLVLTNFSLYENKSKEIVIDLEKSVTCIMGANGLGKSTLLNCINYAITGCINIAGKKIKSVSNFYEGNTYALEYFKGRINDLDKEDAMVSLVFTIGESTISLTRRFFPNNSVVNFSSSHAQYNTYEQTVTQLMGLQAFEQFVFLQLKVFTFDEERECLFWRPDLITPTLYLIMGLDPETAAKADFIARESQRANSRIRNLQFEIRNMSNRISLLKKEIVDDDSENNGGQEEELEKYESLSEKLDEKKQLYKKIELDLNFSTASISELTIKQRMVKTEYDNIYALLFAGNKKESIKNHHLVAGLYKGHCNLCNSKSDNIWSYVETEIQENKCPICHTSLTNGTNDNEEMMQKLEELDAELADIKREIEEHVSKSTRLRNELVATKINIEELEKELAPIDTIQNQIGKSDNLNGLINERIESIVRAIKEVEVEKEKYITKRNNLKVEAVTLHNLLTEKYNTAQFEFIPKFGILAKAFTGLDVDISISRVTDDAREMLMFGLVLGDSSRTTDFQLSESQRFFLDIALRMAIIDYVAGDCNEGCMLVDTPEGSLDIAYETNAGEMFSEFIKRGHQLIVTANLNSSGLIKTLARKTGKTSFDVVNMLLWVNNLTFVQRDREDLFKAALQEIERALVGGNHDLS